MNPTLLLASKIFVASLIIGLVASVQAGQYVCDLRNPQDYRRLASVRALVSKS